MSQNSDEVLVRVEGVSKKFCRSLKKSLWYGVCDIAGELLPGRKRRGARDEGRELSDRSAQDFSRSPLDAGLSTAAASALDSGRSTLDSTHGLRAGEFFAVKDVSFELRRGECLGLIGHNGAGKTTLLKMLNGLIKPDAGSITMRGRVGALIALGAGFNPILTGREPEGWEACRTSNRRLAQRVQRLREGANQNIYINGSVLGLSKKEPERWAAQRKGAAGRPGGLRGLGNREPNRRQDRRDHRLCRDSGIHRYAGAELFLGENLNPSLINFNISNS
jgi:hypothetical protein